MEDVIKQLTPYHVQTVSIDQLPEVWDRKHATGLLVVVGYNIAEMIEEVVEESESLSAFVAEQLERAKDLSKLDVLRSAVSNQLHGTPLASEIPGLADKSFEELYHFYSKIWEGSELIDETPIDVEVEHPVLDHDWIEPRTESGLLLLPLDSEQVAQAPLLIPMGGFNECPHPVQQSVLFASWYSQYGAIPLAVTEDCWVLEVERMPQTDEEALVLAKEHFMFCSDVLDSAFPTIGSYARYLKQAQTWYFWWD